MNWQTKYFKWGYFDGKLYLWVEVPERLKNTIQQFIFGLTDKIYNVVIEEYIEKRSLNANAYFHVLVNKIAEHQNISESETKINLVLEYGAIMRDENGDKVGIKIPSSVNVNTIYKYAKWFDKRIENNREFDCYIVYEHTHKLDKKQMARLIDGAVYEAQQLGIETMTPEQLERLKANWGKGKE